MTRSDLDRPALDRPALDKLFRPRSLALFGASDRSGAVGEVVYRNLQSAGYQGAVLPINPGRKTVGGAPCYPDLATAIRKGGEALETGTVDLAVIATPAETVPDIVTQCGEHGVGAAVVMSAGFREAGNAGRALERDLLRRAQRNGVRILGPNCLGIVRTDIGLNATFSAGNARAGNIAVISQSGALCTAILDWAEVNDVGFSSLVSTGITADVGFGEIIDWVALDPKTDSIMLYVEGIQDARRFMSALRAAARTKPVIVMKSGRSAPASRAAVSHTGALVGSDEVFDAALRRAGAVRVQNFAEFFSTAATLGSGARARGRRLAVVTNAGGPGVMAADHCADAGLELAALDTATLDALDAELPAAWSGQNPVDILGDAGPERYQRAVAACLADTGVDAVLVVLTPQAMTEPDAVADALLALRETVDKPLLACWIGGRSVQESRRRLEQGGIPAYATPAPAVHAFAALADWHDNQQQLLQVPGPLLRQDPALVDDARAIIEGALGEGRTVLRQAESKAVLAAFRIPILHSLPAESPQQAMLIAQETGFPVAMKIDSPDITHKTDVGGVRLGLQTAREVRDAYGALMATVGERAPEASLAGVVIEPMWRGRHGRELMIGLLRDEVFGPVVTFGIGGTLVEVIRDRAVSLAPLNRFLAGRLIEATRAARWLAAVRGTPAANREALVELLLRVSEMACELPMIREMDLNPVIADPDGAIAVDARIVVAADRRSDRPYDHMAIHPYPRDLAREAELPDGTRVTLRPIRPEDAEKEAAFVAGLSEQTRYLRFMHAVNALTPDQLARFTQIDYDREMALIATVGEDGDERQVAVARYSTLPDPRDCEFAIVVADDWQDRGLARRLMRMLIDVARQRGYRRMVGTVLATNRRMRDFARSLGFTVEPCPDDPEVVEVVYDL